MWMSLSMNDFKHKYTTLACFLCKFHIKVTVRLVRITVIIDSLFIETDKRLLHYLNQP